MRLLCSFVYYAVQPPLFGAMVFSTFAPLVDKCQLGKRPIVSICNREKKKKTIAQRVAKCELPIFKTCKTLITPSSVDNLEINGGSNYMLRSDKSFSKDETLYVQVSLETVG